MPDDTNQNKNYSKIQIRKLEKSEVEIEGEISAEKLGSSRKKAVERLAETLEIPGFRKGKAPESVIVKHIGSDYPILEDAAEIALNDEYPNILIEHEIDAIGHPQISITKLAPGNPLAFKIKTAVLPSIELPDYGKIAKDSNAKKAAVEVADVEVEDALQTIRKNKAHYDLHEKLGGDQHDHSHGEIKEEDLPPLDDAFAASVGEFKTLDELRVKVKENLAKEKEYKARDQRRIEMMDKIVSAMKVELPDVLVESELEKMVGQFKDDIARAGLSFEDYLEQAKKTEHEIRAEWRKPAEQKAKYQLALNEIASAEKLQADPEMLEHETEQLASIYKDADRTRVRIYVETMLTNEKVLKFLEEQA